MKPAPFNYIRPTSLSEAQQVLAATDDAKVLAGGQSLVALLSMRLAGPSLLVDINGVPGLDHITVDPAGIRVGALARHSRLLADPRAAASSPLVTKALANVAHPTIRNRGTTVGSLVHADAAAEMPMVLRLLEGSVDVVGTDGRRTIQAEDLYIGPLESSLAHDEIAVEAFFPALPDTCGTAFEEIARRHGDYAMCGVGCLVELEGPAVVRAKLGFISVSDVPVVVDVTQTLDGRHDSDATAAAAEFALKSVEPSGDIHASAEYRAHLVEVLTARVLAAAYADALSKAQGAQ